MTNKEFLEQIRHSTAHLLAAAVLDLWPGTHNAIGPSIENGFYQDFDFGDIKITDEDLGRIEAKMHEILKTWTTFTINEVSVEKAKEDFTHNPYKLELIEEFATDGKTITETKQGDFLDLCKGGHIQDPTKDLGIFKLLSLAGAYWRGSEKNKMLTRIYGTAFPTQKDLDKHLGLLEEAKKRDHKKLGRDLELFMFDETSPGMAYWLPKGLVVYNSLYDYARELYEKFGYLEVATPQLNKKELYETSGHWQHYRGDMFLSPMSFIRDETQDVLEGTEVFGIKPMNCPNAMRIFSWKTRSYNDLPLRLAETSILHRFELSGTLNGLFRTRSFRQDDAHIFMMIPQVKSEFEKLMQMIEEMYKPFDLTYKLRFGTRPENFMGDPSDWDTAEEVLLQVLKESGKEFFEAPGEGAFYGPKVDILMKDSLGREWQTGTIQLDFQQPKNFKLEYADANGTTSTPVVMHRAIYGSFERFLGILTEHYAGAFPLWLSPVQVTLLPIADRHVEYAQKVAQTLRDHGIRVTIDSRSETLQAKIREATLQKVPFMGIIGDKEIAADAISVRLRSGEDKGSINTVEFSQKVKEDIDKKT
jgi:threonyl-tRNA synthetase